MTITKAKETNDRDSPVARSRGRPPNQKVLYILIQCPKEAGPKSKAAIILRKARGMAASAQNRSHLLGPVEQNANSCGHRRVHDDFIFEGCREKVPLCLPRFSFKLNLYLIPTLSKLGLGLALAPSDDISRISKDGSLMIGRASHDVFLEVNEQGTEMTAYTALFET